MNRLGYLATLSLVVLLCCGTAGAQIDNSTGSCLDYTTYMHVTANVPGEARFLDRAGDLVYTSGLQVIDVTMPGEPAVVGSFAGQDGDVRALRVSAGYLYVAYSAADGAGFNGLAVYDLADAMMPALVGTLAVPQFMTQMRIVGDRAYLRIDQGMLLIVDVSNPAAPAAQGSIGMGWLDAFDVDGDFVYAVDQVSNDVVVIDVTDPNSLMVDYRLPLPGTVAITFAGGYGYFLNNGGGTSVLQFSAPDQYSLVGSLADVTRPLVARDGLAYCYGNPLQVFDLATPTSPLLLATVPFVVHAGLLDGTRALLGISNSFAEMDLTNTMDLPALAGAVELDATLVAMLTSGTDLVTLSRMGLETFDASDCPAPAAAGSLMWQGDIRGHAMSGNYLYVLFAGATFGRTDLKVFNLSDMTAPVEVASVQLFAEAHGLTANGEYLYTEEFGSLLVIDIYDPLDPYLYTRTDGVGFAPLAAVDGTNMVVGDGTMLRHFDVTWSDTPEPTTSVDMGVEIRQVLLGGSAAYVVHAGGVKIYDVTSFGAKNLIGDLTVPGIVDGAVLDGTTLYVEGSGIFMFDVTDPAAAMFAGNLGYVADRASNLTIAGDCLYFDQYISGDRGRLNIAHRHCAGGSGGPGDDTGVLIDIKPGSDHNHINCRNDHGVIPVAILTTDTFDALTVDHKTVRFGPGEALEAHENCGRGHDDGDDDDDDGDDDDDKSRGGNNNGHGNDHGDRGGRDRDRHGDRHDDRDNRHGHGHGSDRDCTVTRHEEDVDGDGDIDLVLHFPAGDAAIACGDTEAWLWGETFDGVAFSASDIVNTGHGSCSEGEDDGHGDTDKGLPGQKMSLALAPNPFNPMTTIAFSVPDSRHLRVEVYDVTGRRVAVVADEVFAAGENRLTWQGMDDAGRPAASGVYFVRVTGQGVELNQRAVLLK